MQQNEIHDRAAGLFVPDTLLSTQYFDRIRRRKDLTGEQRLMFAVIEDAIDTYRKHAAATRREHRELFEEAERWIASADRSYLYTFETICDYLGLESEYVRRGLHAWKARARGEAIALRAAEPGEAPEERYAVNE
jgi:hypothetical protein